MNGSLHLAQKLNRIKNIELLSRRVPCYFSNPFGLNQNTDVHLKQDQPKQTH